MNKLIPLLLILFCWGCAQNPVTQQSELHWVSQKQEIKMGNQHYPLAQQMNGGTYTLDPELTAYVQEVGQKLAKVSDRNALPFEFVVLNDSIPNAWALPGGKIAVNRGLLIHLNSEAELAAVLGHEITHATARHGAKAMERQLALGAGLGVVGAIIGAKTDNEGMQDLAQAGALLSATLITLKYSREAEREADHYGIHTMVKAGYDPQAAVDLQKTFIKLSESKSQHWLKGLLASHPPSQERAKRNAFLATTLGSPALNWHQERYQQKIAFLKKQQPAYDAFDEGRKAYEKKEYANAFTQAEKAIQLEPKEGLFYALKGDVLVAQHHPEQAISWYSQAIERHPKYFYYYLQRGLAYEKTKHYKQAKQDLKQAQILLPTEMAQQALTRIGLNTLLGGGS